MTSLPYAQLSHLGLNVRDMRAMVDFYTRMLGMQIVDSGVMGGREQARPNLPSAFQPFLFARPEASDAVRAMGSGWDQSWRLRKLEDIWRDEVVLIGRMARAPADILLDGIPATDNPSRGAVLVRVLLPVVRSVELPE